MALSQSFGYVEVARRRKSAARRWRPDGETMAVTAALGGLAFNYALGALSPLIFLISGCLLAVSRLDRTVDALLRHWPILLLPFYTLLSTFWSAYPALTLRYSLQLTLTMVIAVLIASRVSASQLVRILFAIFTAVMLMSVLAGRDRLDGIALGIFASKNAYAANISIFMLTAAAVLLDREAARWVRWIALAGLAVSPVLMLSAQGAGAMVTTAAALAVFPVVIAAARLNRRSRSAYFAIMITLISLVMLIGVVFGDQIFASVLAYFGKDSTITGRTDLWSKGLEYIGQNPLLGVGYQAFWVQGSPAAEELWEMFMIASRIGFHFHNAYVSIAVELGIVGALLSTGLLWFSLLRSLRWAIRLPSGLSGFFAAFSLMLFGRSFVEVDVFYQFNIPTVVVVCSILYAGQAKASHSKRAALARRAVLIKQAAAVEPAEGLPRRR